MLGSDWGSDWGSDSAAASEDGLGWSEDEGSMEVDEDPFVLEVDDGAGGRPKKVGFAVLGEAAMVRRQEEEVEAAAGFLQLDRAAVKCLLRYFKWDKTALLEAWFADEAETRARVGLPEEDAMETGGAPPAGATTCGICFEEHPADAMSSAACGHHFCKDCYSGYLRTAVEAGPSCLDLRCVHPNCKALVPEALFRQLLPEDGGRKYAQFGARSFVDENQRAKWCPAAGCGRAVELGAGEEVAAAEVECGCGHAFCFGCLEETHRPLDCGLVKEWQVKNSAESENMNWILANSKPCPKCSRPIEKNAGCMHMCCAVCKHEFCWLCGQPWRDHGEGTGGYYACNRYETAKRKGEYAKEQGRRDKAKNSLERYMHYYERFSFNEDSAATSAKELRGLDAQLQEISQATGTPTSQLRFIEDAWRQVIRSSKRLKWTYAYGYYHFGIAKDAKKKEFFEFLQGEAERNLLRLKDFLDKDLKEVTDEEKGKGKDFGAVQSTLTGMTQVTKEYFEKLVDELEMGLGDLGSRYSSSFAADGDPGASGSGEGKQKAEVAPGAGAGAGAPGPQTRKRALEK